MKYLLLVLLFSSSANAAWQSADYTAGRCTSVMVSGVDLSTVTTALAGKQAADADLDDLADGSLTASKLASGYLSSGLSGTVAATLIDLSTVTTRINDLYTTKLSTGVTVPANLIDLSTTTSAIALKAPLASPTFTGTVTTSGISVTTGTFAGAARLASLSIATLRTTVSVVGDTFYCNNCSPKKIVVATGTSAGNFADAVGAAFK